MKWKIEKISKELILWPIFHALVEMFQICNEEELCHRVGNFYTTRKNDTNKQVMGLG
jgi:hypothetical protein